MGRDVRRVPLDFDWPQGETWQGYLRPDSLHGEKCPDCKNGATDALEWVTKVAYIIGGLADDIRDQERGRPMHPYLVPLREISYGYGIDRPSEDFVEFATGLAPDADGGFLGFDPHRMQSALIKAAGLPDKWGWCPTCEGEASLESYPGQRDEADAWEPTDPPAGEGWQMWETTSEGSPMSPVFATPEELARWLADTGASVFGSNTLDYAGWMRQITGEDFGYVSPDMPGAIFI